MFTWIDCYIMATDFTSIVNSYETNNSNRLTKYHCMHIPA